MSAVQSIRSKSGASSQKARATASKDDGDEIAAAPDDAVDEVAAEPAPPPPGMGLLFDKIV